MVDDSKPAEGLAKSLGDRLTFPSDSKTDAASAAQPAAKLDWADDEEEPPQKKADGEEGKDGVGAAQQDGSNAWINGSMGLEEPEFDVNVKLSDLQNDPNNPLHSVKAFDELNL